MYFHGVANLTQVLDLLERKYRERGLVMIKSRRAVFWRELADSLEIVRSWLVDDAGYFCA